MHTPLRTLVACGVLWAGPAFTGERVIQLDDYLVIRGKVLNCEDMGEFVVHIARVNEEVEDLFGHLTPVVGRTETEVTSSVSDAFETDFGRRPGTLRIVALTEQEYLVTKQDLRQSMSYYQMAIEACKRRLERLRIEFRNLVESETDAEPDRITWRKHV